MYLGIEIGGTKLQLGLGTGDGKLSFVSRASVKPEEGAAGIRMQIKNMVDHSLRYRNIQAVGIGFGGPIDDETHTIIKSHQIEGWENFPLEDWINDLLEVPAVVGNDADVAGLGEALLGAGQGISPLFYITIGTGIGGGLIIDGEIYRGAGRGAAEIGHLKVFSYSDYSTGSLEHFCSGPAIAARAKEMMSSRTSSLNGIGKNATAQDVANAARQGDGLAIDVINSVIHYMADAIHQVVVVLCPRRIVIGGGVSLMGEDLFFAPLRERLRNTFPPFEGLTDIIPAALGEEVVLHGAIALAKREFGG